MTGEIAEDIAFHGGPERIAAMAREAELTTSVPYDADDRLALELLDEART